MEIPELQSFNLVDGTALALKYGHRTSVDLDLFSVENFNHQFPFRKQLSILKTPTTTTNR